MASSLHSGAAGSSVKAPYIPQDVGAVSDMIKALDENQGKGKRGKGGPSFKKTRFQVADSPDQLAVDSWRMQEWDYKRRDLPTYARGLFTVKSRDGVREIAIRGYDKFFNTNEVYETRWENIESRTTGPYDLTLKENGCIIFMSGLPDDTLLVCSKHSTGPRDDETASHAVAGETRLDAQLQKLGKTRQDLARELRARNVTAVAELCDDSFEEHILPYGPEAAGLYLHGMNLNLPHFVTYPATAVQDFARQWGFRITGNITMDSIADVRKFLDGLADSGAYDGRDLEGFVIRCKMSPKPGEMPWQDWFFKYKFEEPYLMYRQWRECTKALISGKAPKYKKHAKITEEYLKYARTRLARDPNLGELYNQNHGIIALRNEFLEMKKIRGVDAANVGDDLSEELKTVDRDVVLVPIATIGCGKTTVGQGLVHLFGWGHIQNDNITGKQRPVQMTQHVVDLLEKHPAVISDRNNSEKRERKQVITDVKQRHTTAKLVALNFKHTDLERIRQLTHERVFARGDNHQTIQAASDQKKVAGIMENFVHRFQDCDPDNEPDNGFEAIIDLDATKESRENLETAVQELHRIFPKLVPEVPSSEALDAAIMYALDEYKPNLRHSIPDRGKNKPAGNGQTQSVQQAGGNKKKPLEYMAVSMAPSEVNKVLTTAFDNVPPQQSMFYKQLVQTRRVQAAFHVTLMHRASSKQYPDVWERYQNLQKEAEEKGILDGKVGDCAVMLERIVWDARIMAIVVRLVPSSSTTPKEGPSETAQQGGEMTRQNDDEQTPEWTCVNRVAHITVGTRDNTVKPKESNDLLAKWLEEGAGDHTGIGELAVEGQPVMNGAVKAVLSR